MEIMLKNTSLLKKNMIYVITQEGLYKNKVNSSLVYLCTCKMDNCQLKKKYSQTRIFTLTVLLYKKNNFFCQVHTKRKSTCTHNTTKHLFFTV